MNLLKLLINNFLLKCSPIENKFIKIDITMRKFFISSTVRTHNVSTEHSPTIWGGALQQLTIALVISDRFVGPRREKRGDHFEWPTSITKKEISNPKEFIMIYKFQNYSKLLLFQTTNNFSELVININKSKV